MNIQVIYEHQLIVLGRRLTVCFTRQFQASNSKRRRGEVGFLLLYGLRAVNVPCI